MKAAWLLALVAASLAAIDGAVVNRTSGKPQAGVTVTLFKLEAGMDPVASARTDASGRFTIDTPVSGAQLLQASWAGVTYNHMLQPGSPSSGLTLAIYDSSREAGGARLAQRMVLLEPGASKLAVRESYFFNNGGNITWNDPAGGTLRFETPKGKVSGLQVMATAPGGMPIPRSAAKAGRENGYKVDFPIRPGETRLDVNYEVPFTSPGKFATRLVQKSDSTMLAVPTGVKVKGAGLAAEGQEPRSGAAVFRVTGDKLDVEIEGSGQLASAGATGEEDTGPPIQQIPARIDEKRILLLALAAAILLVGFVRLLRSRKPEPAAPPPPVPAKGKRK